MKNRPPDNVPDMIFTYLSPAAMLDSIPQGGAVLVVGDKWVRRLTRSQDRWRLIDGQTVTDVEVLLHLKRNGGDLCLPT